METYLGLQGRRGVGKSWHIMTVIEILELEISGRDVEQ